MASNSSVPSPSDGVGIAPPAGFQVLNLLTYLFLCAVMFGIGAGVSIDSLKRVLRKCKYAVAVCLGCQYIIMPAASRFVASVLLQLPDEDAVVLILISCCPGGAISNAVTVLAKGNVALSVTLTTLTNGLAFVTVPFLLFIWTQGLNSTDTATPYLEIFFSLLMVLVPAGIGIFLNQRCDHIARKAERAGSVGGALMILSAVIAGIATQRDTIRDPELLPWKNVVAVSLVAPLGMIFATLVLFCYGRCRGQKRAMDLPERATVTIETGVQNTVLALAIVTLSFRGTDVSKAFFRKQLTIIFWGVVVTFEAFAVMLLFRRWILHPSNTVDGASERTEGKCAANNPAPEAEKIEMGTRSSLRI